MLETIKILQIIICIAMIAIILLQNKNVSLNLSSMSGSTGAITKRGPEKILHNTTIILGSLFILNSLVLFILS